jgi:hypothetical protein
MTAVGIVYRCQWQALDVLVVPRKNDGQPVVGLPSWVRRVGQTATAWLLVIPDPPYAEL